MGLRGRKSCSRCIFRLYRAHVTLMYKTPCLRKMRSRKRGVSFPCPPERLPPSRLCSFVPPRPTNVSPRYLLYDHRHLHHIDSTCTLHHPSSPNLPPLVVLTPSSLELRPRAGVRATVDRAKGMGNSARLC